MTRLLEQSYGRRRYIASKVEEMRVFEISPVIFAAP